MYTLVSLVVILPSIIPCMCYEIWKIQAKLSKILSIVSEALPTVSEKIPTLENKSTFPKVTSAQAKSEAGNSPHPHSC